MPLVNRLLDAFFRTLDAVDMARERLDRALGRSPQPEPWTTEWSPVPSSAPAPHVAQAPAPHIAQAPAPSVQQKKRTTTKPAPAKARANGGRPVGKKGGGNRKGSVDRSGKDLDSPRAKAIVQRLRDARAGVVTEDANIDGKRVLARVLWALAAADQAGSELGLTAADASALLYLAAHMEVFATNVARTCRDETELVVESVPDGRSKRYKLTEAGLQAAAGIATQPVATQTVS